MATKRVVLSVSAPARGLEPQPGWKLEHTPRQIEPAGVFAPRGWQLKLYGIRGRDRQVPAQLFNAARILAASNLPSPAQTADRYGVGFAICHDARDFDTVTLDWWERSNELRHQVFRSRAEAGRFENITHLGEAACIWELAVMGFERDAWIGAVLKDGRRDFAEYLARSLTAHR